MMVFWRLWVSKMLGMALSCYLQKAMELALLRFAIAYWIITCCIFPHPLPTCHMHCYQWIDGSK